MSEPGITKTEVKNDTAQKILGNKPFTSNKSSFGTTILRLKEGESLEDAIIRWRKDGWNVPDASQLVLGSDGVSKYVTLK